MDDADFFSTITITVPIGFKIVRDCTVVSIVNNRENIRLSVTVTSRFQRVQIDTK